MELKSLKRTFYWSIVLFYTVLLYSTLSVVRPLCTYLKHNGFLKPVVMIVLIIALTTFISGVWLQYKKKTIRKMSTVFLLLFAISIYGLIMSVVTFPEEKIHFIEYSVLAILVFFALNIDLTGFTLFLTGFLLVAMIGWFDEVIQYFLPNRVYDLRDVTMNIFAGFFGFLIIGIVRLEGRKAESIGKI